MLSRQHGSRRHGHRPGAGNESLSSPVGWGGGRRDLVHMNQDTINLVGKKCFTSPSKALRLRGEAATVRLAWSEAAAVGSRTTPLFNRSGV